MTDLSDVLNIVKSAVLQVLYPPTAMIGGTVTPGDVLTITATAEKSLSFSYTVRGGDTLQSIAAGLQTAAQTAFGFMSPCTVGIAWTTLTFNLAPGVWSLSQSVVGTETITLGSVPSNGASPITGDKVAVASGWPPPASLDGLVGTRQAIISIFTLPGMYKNVTRYPTEWQVSIPPVATITATVNDTQVSIGGTVSTPQNVSLTVGANGALKSYVYSLQPSDTPSTIAIALAVAVNVDTPASAVGPVITIPAAHRIIARVGAYGTVIKEIGRQSERVSIDIWCPSPTLRNTIAQALRPILYQDHFLVMPDRTAARVIPAGDHDIDEAEKVGLYRRCFLVDVEFATTISAAAPQIVVPQAVISGSIGPTQTFSY